MANETWYASSVAQLAHFLDRSDRQVERYLAAGLPREQIGRNRFRYSLRDAHLWVIRHELKEKEQAHAEQLAKMQEQLNTAKAPTEDTADDLLKRVLAEKKQFELQKLKGEVIVISDLADEIVFLLRAYRQIGWKVRNHVVQRLSTEMCNDVIGVLREAIQEALDRFAAFVRKRYPAGEAMVQRLPQEVFERINREHD